MNVAIGALVIFTVSLLGGVLFSRRNSAEEQEQNKIVLFVLYFWGLTFFQLVIFALAYTLVLK